MTLRMGDGPVLNLPAGLDAYAGYVDASGIGVTWPNVQQLTARYHLSISVHGAPAMCGDVESGALSGWGGYPVGYCPISRAEALIASQGRPRKLWTAHYTNVPHLCSSACGFGFTGTADGTQWTDHGGAWDESLLLDDFFDFLDPPSNPQLEEETVIIGNDKAGDLIVVGKASDNGHLMVFTQLATGAWSVADVTDQVHNSNPADTRVYAVD